jgi:hypothetical protein
MPPAVVEAAPGRTKESTAPSAISNVVELLPKAKPVAPEFSIVVLTVISVVSARRQGAGSAASARSAARQSAGAFALCRKA